MKLATVSIIGCGPSALRCGASEAPGYVLAVNDAALHVRHDAVVSMDGRWALERVPRLLTRSPEIWLRDRAWKKLEQSSQPPHVHTFQVDTKTDVLGTDDKRLVGLNSGAVAINLAAVSKPKTIYLYGFDAAFEGAQQHFFGDYPWVGQGDKLFPKKLRSWAAQMHQFAGQLKALGIRVVNTNADSAIVCFETGRP